MDAQASATAARATEATASEASAHEAKPSTAQEEVVEDDPKMEEAVAAVRAGVESAGKKWKTTVLQGFMKVVLDWLLARDEDVEDVVATVVGLIVYGATTEEKLLLAAGDPPDAKDFRSALAEEGVPKAICDLLFAEYVSKKRAGSRGSEQSGKRQCVEQSVTSPTAEFFREIDKGVLSGDFILFARNMLGNALGTNVLFVRSCYITLVDSMLEVLESKKANAAIVMGTPGTGKTVCGLFAVHHLLSKDATVLYSYGASMPSQSGTMFLMGPANSRVFAAARDAGFRIPDPEGKWVGQVLTSNDPVLPLEQFLLNQPDLYYILDPPKTGIQLEPGRACKTLVFSSPHRLEHNSLKYVAYMFYMPVWTMEELKTARDKMFPVNGGQELSDESLAERFEIFGGIARHVLSQTYEISLLFYEQNLGTLNLQQAKNVLDPFSQSKDSAGLFVHMQTAPPFLTYSITISTDCVRRYISLQVLQSENRGVKLWAEGLAEVGLNATAGGLLERSWHNSLALFQRDVEGCKFRELGKEDSALTVTLPRFTHRARTFSNRHMSDLSDLAENQYCLPLCNNFETFDSFAVLRKPFCCPTNGRLCIVGFQMTIAEKGHNLKYAGGLRVKKKVEALFKASLEKEKRGQGVDTKLELENMFVVFVVTESVASQPAWKEKQRWVTQNGTETRLMDSVRQFVLVIPER